MPAYPQGKDDRIVPVSALQSLVKPSVHAEPDGLAVDANGHLYVAHLG